MAVSNFAARSDVDVIVVAVRGTLAGYVAPLIVVAHRRWRGNIATRGSEPSDRKKKRTRHAEELKTKVESTWLSYDYLSGGPEMDIVWHLRTRSGVCRHGLASADSGHVGAPTFVATIGYGCPCLLGVVTGVTG